MNLFLKSLILLLSIIIAILIITPLLIDSKSLQIELQNKLNSRFQTNFHIDSNINISLFPVPKVIVNDISIKNFQTKDAQIDINFDKISIIPKITSLFGAIKIKEIELYKTNVKYIISYQLENKINQEINYTPLVNSDFIANKIFGFGKVGDEIFDIINIANIKIIDSTISFNNSDGREYSNYQNINAKLNSDLDGGEIYAKGSFISDDIPTLFEMDIANQDDSLSKLTITSPILEAEIYGNFFESKSLNLTESNFDGEVKMSISNLKLLLDSYISKENLIFRHINNTQDINITGKIFLNKGTLAIENIKIDSAIVKGVGDIIIDVSSNDGFADTNLTIDHLNFDDIWIGKFQPIGDAYTKKLKSDIVNVFNGKSYNIDLPKLDFTLFGHLLKANIDIAELKYKERLIKDVNISLLSDNKKQIKINNISMNIDQDSQLKIYGIMENIGSLIKLDGKLEVNSSNLSNIIDLFSILKKEVKENSLKELRLSSDLLILPNLSIIKNINSVLNSKSLIKGDIIIGEENEILKRNYNLSINRMNIDDFFDSSYVDKFIKGGSFLKNLLWLNNIDIDHQVSLKINKLYFEDILFIDPFIDININRGQVNIRSLLRDKSDDVSDLKLNIDVYSPIPAINLEFKSNRLKIKYDKLQSGDKFESILANYFFDLASFSAFDGDINIDIDDLEINALKANNVIFKAPFKEGLIEIEQMSGNIFDGKIDISGNILMHEKKKINNSFKLLNISNKKLLKSLFNIDNFDSKSNITGIITSYAKNRNEFYNNLNCEAKFISQNVTMHKFGMTDFLAKINRNRKSIKKPKDIIFSDAGKTYFKKVTGNINIKPNNKKREIYISTESIGLNTVTSGLIDVKNNKLNISHNAILMVVASGKPFPIRFALNASGFVDKLQLSPNFSQINQFLNIK